MSTPLLTLDNAEVRYPQGVALKQISLRVYAGEKLALIGRSGSGKSTLLRLIYQTLPDKTALVPQDEGLVSSLSVFHNVYMGRLTEHSTAYNLLNLIRPFPKRVSEVYAILARLQLAEKCFEPIAQLSGGQRQRTAVARSLYQGGELLLADEPVSAVDEQQAKLILQALSESFPTLIVALHDTTLALTHCDRIIGLESGQIVLDRPSSQLSAEDLIAFYADADASLEIPSRDITP